MLCSFCGESTSDSNGSRPCFGTHSCQQVSNLGGGLQECLEGEYHRPLVQFKCMLCGDIILLAYLVGSNLS